ncbi:MAG: hypothetical protein JNL16_01670 [Dechloromonas sp.]|nr:hypothetical protein [Dechloromonas sp.]
MTDQEAARSVPRGHQNAPKYAEDKFSQGTEKHILAKRDEIKQFLAKKTHRKFNVFSPVKHADGNTGCLEPNKTLSMIALYSDFSNKNSVAD